MVWHIVQLRFCPSASNFTTMPSSRRSSSGSTGSFESGSSGEPELAPHESTAALILIHDPEEPEYPFEFSDEDEDYEPLDASNRSMSSAPALSPSTTFLSLLSM